MNYRLLIADDSSNSQKLIKAILRGQNFELFSQESIEGLYEKITYHEIDLLLLDFSFSTDDDGYSIAKKIKQLSPQIKVLIIYGTFDQPDKEKISLAQVDDFIFTPFDGEKLIKSCLHLLGIETTRTLHNNSGALKLKAKEEVYKEIEFEISKWNIAVPDIMSENELIADSFDNMDVPGILDVKNALSLNTDPEKSVNFINKSEISKINIKKEIQNQQQVDNVSIKSKSSNHSFSSSHYPSENDLEYPEITSSEKSITHSQRDFLAMKNQDLDFFKNEFIQQKNDEERTDITTVGRIENKNGLKHASKKQVEKIAIEENGEKTEVVDLAKVNKAQADLLEKLKAQINEEVENDFWESEDPSESLSKTGIIANQPNYSAMMNSQNSLHSDLMKFDKAEFVALKNEMIDTIKNKILKDVKKEILVELKQDIKFTLSEREKDKLVSDLKKTFIKESSDLIYEEVKEDLVVEVKNELKSKITNSLQQHFDKILTDHVKEFMLKQGIASIQKKLIEETENLVKLELARVRKIVEED